MAGAVDGAGPGATQEPDGDSNLGLLLGWNGAETRMGGMLGGMLFDEVADHARFV